MENTRVPDCPQLPRLIRNEDRLRMLLDAPDHHIHSALVIDDAAVMKKQLSPVAAQVDNTTRVHGIRPSNLELRPHQQ